MSWLRSRFSLVHDFAHMKTHTLEFMYTISMKVLGEFYIEDLFNPKLSALKVDSQKISSVMLSSLMVARTFKMKFLTYLKS